MATVVQESVWDVVHRRARADKRVVFIGSDLNPTLLAEMRTELPDQFMMEGIQEQYVIGMAAGMALEGARPVVSTISTFLTRRCFEQLMVDVGLHNAPVILLGTGSGLAYHFFGPTHCAIDDFALLRTIPGITLVAPGSMAEASALLEEAMETERFAYLRVPRWDQVSIPEPLEPYRLGQAIELRPGQDVAILTTGAISMNALAAAEAVADEGLDVRVMHLATVWPLDPEVIRESVGDCRTVVVAEEHLRDGGLGTSLLELISDRPDDFQIERVVRLGLPTAFVSGYGFWPEAIAGAKLDAESLTEALRGLKLSAEQGL